MSKGQAYPLHWPKEWPRTGTRKGSQFKTTLAKAIDNVESALALFAKDSGRKVEKVVISSNYSLTSRRPQDPGVAIYFQWDGLSTCIAVDRYNKLEDNIQAIYHCVEAERTKLRHGGLNLVRAAFRGYAALPPPSAADADAEDWRQVLGVPGCTDLKTAEAAYRKLRSKHHPDNGGNANEFYRVNKAIAAAEEELG